PTSGKRASPVKERNHGSYLPACAPAPRHGDCRQPFSRGLCDAWPSGYRSISSSRAVGVDRKRECHHPVSKSIRSEERIDAELVELFWIWMGRAASVAQVVGTLVAIPLGILAVWLGLRQLKAILE